MIFVSTQQQTRTHEQTDHLLENSRITNTVALLLPVLQGSRNKIQAADEPTGSTSTFRGYRACFRIVNNLLLINRKNRHRWFFFMQKKLPDTVTFLRLPRYTGNDNYEKNYYYTFYGGAGYYAGICTNGTERDCPACQWLCY
jgi:hypothetical protein